MREVALDATLERRDCVVLLSALLVEGVEMQGRNITAASIVSPELVIGAFTALLQLREQYQLRTLGQCGTGPEASERASRVVLEVRCSCGDRHDHETCGCCEVDDC